MLHFRSPLRRCFGWTLLCLSLGCFTACSDDDASLTDAGRDGAAPAEDAPSIDASILDAAALDSAFSDASSPDATVGETVLGPRPVAETPLARGTLFASPDGSGDACSSDAPCDLWTVTERANGGDVVFLYGGTYHIDTNLYFRGRGSPPTIFESVPGELAILEGSGDADDEVYIRVLGDPTVVRRMEVRNMSRSALSVRSNGHLLEGLHVHHNLLSGIHIHESYDTPMSNDNIVRDCIVHDNSGVGLTSPEFADGGNSDGISISSGTNNRVEHCLIYANSDDGVDTWRSQGSHISYSISHSNGLGDGNGQGFKAGGQPPAREATITRCVAYENRAAGFDYNSGVDVTFDHNTSWNNAHGFTTASHTVLQSNISAEEPVGASSGEQTDNSWQRTGEVAFESTDPMSPSFLVPVEGGGFEDIGAHAP